MTILDEQRLEAAKQAFSTRRVPKAAIRGVNSARRKPHPGDVVLARVEEIGRLRRVELPTGRKSTLYEGDELILTYGNRYAPDAYEALIPNDLGPCDLAAAGGLASHVVETNLSFADEQRRPTKLIPVGLCVGQNGDVLNLSDFAISAPTSSASKAPVITVFGASMNAGKTTTVAGIIRGLTRLGKRVGAAKITGTCSGGDLWKFHDAGAYRAYDFTDAGLATSYKESLTTVRTHAHKLVNRLNTDGCDVIVVEIADGLHQQETAALLQDLSFRALVDHWVFAADNASSIAIGMTIVNTYNLTISGVSGSVTASPLALREAEQLTQAPIYSLQELELGHAIEGWMDHQVLALPVLPTTKEAHQLVAM